MKYAAAFALVALAGKEPTKKDIQAVLKAAGADCDASRVDDVIAQFASKPFDEIVAAGQEKMSACGPASGAAPAAGGKAAPAAVVEESEEEDDDMGMDLFS